MDQALRIKEACYGISGKCILDKVYCNEHSIRSMTVRELYKQFNDCKVPIKLFDSSLQDYTVVQRIFKFPDPHNWIIFKLSNSTSILLAANARVLSKNGYLQAWECRINDFLIDENGSPVRIIKKENLGFLCQSSFCIQTESGTFDCHSFRHQYKRWDHDKIVEESNGS